MKLFSLHSKRKTTKEKRFMLMCISCRIGAYTGDACVLIFETSSKQSDAITNSCRFRSRARARASLHACTSKLAGSIKPSKTSSDAPKNFPDLSQQITATAPFSPRVDNAPSQLIFTASPSGGSHARALGAAGAGTGRAFWNSTYPNPPRNA